MTQSDTVYQVLKFVGHESVGRQKHRKICTFYSIGKIERKKERMQEQCESREGNKRADVRDILYDSKTNGCYLIRH